MDRYAELAVAKQSFEALLAMADPADVESWNPSDAQRITYVNLAERTVAGLRQFERLEQQQFFREGRVQSFVPESLLTFLREEIKPQLPHVKAALDHLDPDGKFIREFLYEPTDGNTAGHSIRATFDQGLDQVYQLLDRNSDWEGRGGFQPEAVGEFLDSRLVNFEPDAWLARAREITPIRTSRSNVELPMHLRIRLEELYRAYVFGLWVSVLGLCRSIMEYAIVDNAHKFKITRQNPPDRSGRQQDKKLSHLIEELAESLPLLRKPMESLRDQGNKYLHPKNTDMSKESLLRRQIEAKQALITLLQVVEDLYRAPKLV